VARRGVALERGELDGHRADQHAARRRGLLWKTVEETPAVGCASAHQAVRDVERERAVYHEQLGAVVDGAPGGPAPAMGGVAVEGTAANHEKRVIENRAPEGR